MKTRISFGILAVMLAAAGARGSFIETYTESYSGAATVIPDGNPVGITSLLPVGNTPSAATINSLTVTLQVSGGYDGNLVAYLVAPNGTMVSLLNQPGGAPFGNPTLGMDITLQDGAPAITSSSSLASGTYSAAGTLGNFDGLNANGTWDLFFADVVSGGGTATLTGWSLDVNEVVPEPVNGALMVFAVLGGLWWVGRRMKARMGTPAESGLK